MKQNIQTDTDTAADSATRQTPLTIIGVVGVLVDFLIIQLSTYKYGCTAE